MKRYFKDDQYESYKSVQVKQWKIKSTKKRAAYEYETIFNHFYPLLEKTALRDKRRKYEMICLGARNSHEKKCFADLFSDKKRKINIFSLDIAESAPVDYHYDFADMPDSWKGRFSVIYTNAPDHAFDFSSCLEEWKRVLSDNGVIIIGISDINLAESNFQEMTKKFKPASGQKLNLTPQDCMLFSKEELDNLFLSSFSKVTYIDRSTVMPEAKKMNYNYWICEK
jgi:hypothetical protein